MNIFKKIIRLFKKPPVQYQPPVIGWMGDTNRIIIPVNRNPTQEQILNAHRTIERIMESYRIEEMPSFRGATLFRSSQTTPHFYVETRKRIPVNKEIDPFEEEIWYEDELSEQINH